MDYKKLNEQLELILIGDEKNPNSIENSFLYKLRCNEWDEEKYQKIKNDFDEFGKAFANETKVDNDVRGILELLLLFMGDVLIYLEKDKEKQLEAYEELAGCIGNGTE